ncbi:YaaC family protein [Plantactinospora endophytica]|uniref:YaaC-like Protein n=1 Tax=Plantactinospora endophytica TaxID=673535 RepID=A0ABQ4EF21_9ACTN|nr:hypothetical protein [Plantactinospora endophytica]GIG93310.1 hypothetical protein Pen02_82460 [Plantactinospora endophytica]
MISDTSWQPIRALRATPTGLAATDPDRRATFVAALRQAEELAEAARVGGYAARPLSLFYCLSQAGRAIAAAHLPGQWHLRGHGLSVNVVQGSLLRTTIKPAGQGNDSFRGVASAIGSPSLTGSVSLGALWAANPDLRATPVPQTAGRWPKALEISLGTQSIRGFGGNEDPTQHMLTTDGTVTFPVDLPGSTGAEIAEALKSYPTLSDAFGWKQGPRGYEAAGSKEAVIRILDHAGVARVAIGKEAPREMPMAQYWERQRTFASIVEIDERYPRYPDPNLVGFALPQIADAPSPHPLMLWWALLLGLSSLARYEPASWTSAIDLDTSPAAVSLERVLDVATERLPHRVHEALRATRP